MGLGLLYRQRKKQEPDVVSKTEQIIQEKDKERTQSQSEKSDILSSEKKSKKEPKLKVTKIKASKVKKAKKEIKSKKAKGGRETYSSDSL